MNTQRATLDGRTLLRSQLHGVADETWRKFVHALTICDEQGADGQLRNTPRGFDARSYAGGYGCFDLRPKRLADLGLMRNVHTELLSGRVICVGDFIAPMTERKFLSSPLAQYNTLLESLRRYDAKLLDVAQNAAQNITRSGSLALLHRLGPNAISKWLSHQERSTLALYNRTNGLF